MELWYLLEASFLTQIMKDPAFFYNPIIILRSPSNITLTFPGIIGGPFMNKEGLTSLWFTVVPNNTKRMYGIPNAIMLREFQFMESVQEVEMYFQVTSL